MSRRDVLAEAFWATVFHLAGMAAMIWHALRRRPV